VPLPSFFMTFTQRLPLARGSGAVSCARKSAEIAAEFGPIGGTALHG
jgi:hypothetical protein